jgi:hypothetical protein
LLRFRGTRWVLFNPARMFLGDYKSAFRFFCKWVNDCAKRGPGKKLFLVDEVWQWQERDRIPTELDLVVRASREEHIELVCATQTPGDVSYSICGQSTELVCFHLDEPRRAGLHPATGGGRRCRPGPA